MSLFRPRPKLSIVVIVYKMPDQAEKTLLSLSPAYQQGVREKDYEVIVVENHSDRLLGAARACQHASNVRYYHRQESQRSPVNAINFGAAQARGRYVAIMIDGARMLTPGVVRLTLSAFQADPQAAVSAPGYHIGHKLQQVAVNEGYDEQAEAELLKSIAWPQDGYSLFDIAVLSGSCQGGFFQSNYESNFIAMPTKKWKALGEHPLVGEARIAGMVGALELVPDKSRREFFPDRGRVGQLCRDIALRNGLILRATYDSMLLSPPLVISRAQVDELAEKAWKSLDMTARELGMPTG